MVYGQSPSLSEYTIVPNIYPAAINCCGFRVSVSEVVEVVSAAVVSEAVELVSELLAFCACFSVEPQLKSVKVIIESAVFKNIFLFFKLIYEDTKIKNTPAIEYCPCGPFW